MFDEELSKILPSERILRGEPLSLHTTFKIGGKADYFTVVESEDELKAVLKLSKEEGIRLMVLGNGSNTLFADGGFRGIIVKLGTFFTEIRALGDETIYAGAGASLSRIAQFALEHEWKGFEFAGGIPGTFGGGLIMNAGAYGGELAQVVVNGRYIDPETLEVEELEGDAQEFGYRHSKYMDMGAVVLGATIKLARGSRSEIASLMQELNQKRRDKQPLELPSAGSAFKRPVGDFAGRLIEVSGLRGYKIGGAQISEKHCGFIVNAGGATAGDVLSLVKHVQDTVYAKQGVMLEPEIRLIPEK